MSRREEQEDDDEDDEIDEDDGDECLKNIARALSDARQCSACKKSAMMLIVSHYVGGVFCCSFSGLKHHVDALHFSSILLNGEYYHLRRGLASSCRRL